MDEHEAGDARMIDAHGDIDLATVAHLSDALQRAVAGQWNTIVVDIADVTFLGLVGSHPIEDAIQAVELACVFDAGHDASLWSSVRSSAALPGQGAFRVFLNNQSVVSVGDRLALR